MTLADVVESRAVTDGRTTRWTRRRRAAGPGAPGRRRPTAAQVMDRRPPVADHHTSLWGAWGLLGGSDRRHLVVVDESLHPVGVLEARDLALRWPPGPYDSHTVPLHQVLTAPPVPRAQADDDIAGVARTMLAAGTDALPVVDDDGRLLGLVTARHCVELLASRAAA